MARKILIADDEANIVLSLEFLMRHAGYEVRSAADGEEDPETVPDSVHRQLKRRDFGRPVRLQAVGRCATVSKCARGSARIPRTLR